MEKSPKWFSRRVQINRDGYDPSGRYWGRGIPLYWCHSESGDLDFYIRGTKDYARAACAFVRGLSREKQEIATHRITSTGTWKG